MKYALLGGSFDPVHNGHLHIARAALKLGYDCVICVPAFQSPFKARDQRATADTRLRLLLAALGSDRRLTADACELEREGVSYTVDTIDDIYRRYVPEGKIGLLIGDDLVDGFDKWQGAEKIAAQTDIIIARRYSAAAPAFPHPHRCIDNDILTVSSQYIRGLIAEDTGGTSCAGGAGAGGDADLWQQFVPPAVRDLIVENRLYTRAAENAPTAGRRGLISEIQGANPQSLTQAAFTLLDTRRYLHSRNVALHSAYLCERYGLDPQKGWLAGIAHDICKGLTTQEFFRLAALDQEAAGSRPASFSPLAYSPPAYSPLELSKPGLLHGRAAAALLRTAFNVTDADILEAVRWHTSGRRGIGDLAKIVYLTDKIEAGRNTVEPRLRELAFGGSMPALPLDALFDTVLRATIAWLEERGLELAPETIELKNTLN